MLRLRLFSIQAIMQHLPFICSLLRLDLFWEFIYLKNIQKKTPFKKYACDIINIEQYSKGCHMQENDQYLSISPDYRPSEDEPYMSNVMVSYFRQKLLAWRKQLLEQSVQGMRRVQTEAPLGAESIDRAGMETIRGEELGRLGQDEYLIFQIDEALERLENGTYGYCQVTGEPIGIKRLEAWPIASLSAEAQAKSEKHLI